MRILATWAAALVLTIRNVIELIRFFSFGPIANADKVAINHRIHFIVWSDICLIAFTVWAVVYLLRAKNKLIHEKIGLGINLYWLAYTATFSGMGLFLRLPGK